MYLSCSSFQLRIVDVKPCGSTCDYLLSGASSFDVIRRGNSLHYRPFDLFSAPIVWEMGLSFDAGAGAMTVEHMLPYAGIWVYDILRPWPARFMNAVFELFGVQAAHLSEGFAPVAVSGCVHAFLPHAVQLVGVVARRAPACPSSGMIWQSQSAWYCICRPAVSSLR